jgi:hypothetical protein
MAFSLIENQVRLFQSLFFLNYWMKINDLVPPSQSYKLYSCSVTLICIIRDFWWRWAKVSYNNFKHYPPFCIWVSFELGEIDMYTLLAPKWLEYTYTVICKLYFAPSRICDQDLTLSKHVLMMLLSWGEYRAQAY